MTLSTFSQVICHLYIFIKIKSVEIAHFLTISYYCVLRVLHIFWIQALYQIYDFPVFSSNLCSLVFFLLTVSFEKQKFLILIKSTLSIFFSFIDLAFGLKCKKSLLSLVPQRFSPISLMIWAFVFRSVIHLSWFLYTVWGVDQSSLFFHFGICVSSYSSTWNTIVKMCRPISVLYILFHWSVYITLILHYLDYS